MNLKFALKEESFKLEWGMDNVQKDNELYKHTSINLISGKNDWSAFQILIKADEDFTLSLGNNPLFTPKGLLKNIRLEAKVEENKDINLTMQPIKLIEDDDRIYKADLILNEDVIHVNKNFTQCIWTELIIPDKAKSGLFKGKIYFYEHVMFEDEKIIGTMDFQLNVKDVTLPKPKDYKFHLDLWQHLSNIARKHEVILWSDEHFHVIEKYVDSLAKLGQKAITVISSEIPWSGQRSFNTENYISDLFEYSMIKVEKDKNETFNYDFSIVERYIDLCMKRGIDKEIEVFGLIGIWTDEAKCYSKVAEDFKDAIRIRYLDKKDKCYKYMKTADEIKQYIKALENYFIEKGWIELVRIVADEPSDVNLYKERLNLLSDIAPTFKFKAAINRPEFIEEFKDKVTDFVPIFPSLCEKLEFIQSMKENINGKLCWYVCCIPEIPNTFIKSHLLESQFIGLLTAYLELDGFLRWNYTVWPENPREKISYRFPEWSAGDTNFVYPANNGSPILTLRYKNLKRGIEEYELIQILKQTHPTASKVLENLWNIIFKTRDILSFHPSKEKKIQELFSLEYENYYKIRDLLLNEIGKHL